MEKISLTMGRNGRVASVDSATTPELMALITHLYSKGAPSSGIAAAIYQARFNALTDMHFNWGDDGVPSGAETCLTTLAERAQRLVFEWREIASAATTCSDLLTEAAGTLLLP